MISLCRTRRRASTCLLVLLILFGAMVLRTPGVSAHAELAQSEPPAQSSVTRAPEQVRLVFTETLEPRSVQVQVLGQDRNAVDQGDSQLVPGTQDQVVVSLGDVPPGLYTISWQVTSTVDGHTTRGLVPFNVGDPGAVPEPLSAADIGQATSEESSVQTGPAGVIARWLVLVSMVALGGLFVTGPLLLRPTVGLLSSLQHRNGDAAVTKEAPGQVAGLAMARIFRLCALLLLLFGIGGVLLLLVDAAAFAGTSLSGALGSSITDWLGTRRGVLWSIRTGLAVVLLGLLALPSFRQRAAANLSWWWAPAALVGGMLLMTSLSSHSAALRSGAAIATAVDWIHMLAVTLWVGGLLFLALVLLPALAPLAGPARTQLLASLVPRFSSLALASVAVIVLTGAYQTWQLLDGWDALRELTWGRSLVVKLALVVLLLGLGAVNLLVIRPRMAAYASRMDRATRERAAWLRFTFRRVVLAEAGLGVLIVLVVGVLTGTTPSQAVSDLPEGPFRPFVLKATAEDLTGTLVLSPGRIGNNRFDVTIEQANGQPLPNVTEMVLRIFTLDQDTGIAEARTESLGGGRFTTAGPYLSTVGLWEVAAVVRRPGMDEATLAFRLSLTEATGRPQEEESRPAAPLARGREIYQQNCIQCHGTAGKGDGPLAAALRPPPLDLTVHVPLHPDQDIVAFITNGVSRTAMPAFGGQFSEEEIQAIVNYLRELARQGR